MLQLQPDAQLGIRAGKRVEQRGRGRVIPGECECAGDLGQQYVVGKGRIGRLSSRPESALTGAWVVEVPQRIDLRLVGARECDGGGLAQSGRKTKTSRMISAKSAVRYVIE